MTRPKDNSQTSGEPRGLCCATCGCRHFLVVYTRRASQGRVLRRRECRHCGRRITTWEAQVNQWPETSDSN